MHKYGHMVKEGDQMTMLLPHADGKRHLTVVEVKDIWPSKYYLGSRWLELWTVDSPTTVPYPAALKRVGDFDNVGIYVPKL